MHHIPKEFDANEVFQNYQDTIKVLLVVCKITHYPKERSVLKVELIVRISLITKKIFLRMIL